METVFKKEDRVYCIIYGWGIVLEVCDKGSFPVQVFFDCGEEIDYTLDGRLYADSNPMLSFTKYTLQGFTQERPIQLPEVGELCLVRNNDSDSWIAKKFIAYNPEQNLPYETEHLISYKQIKRIKILD